jgi:predicted transcriptional regulator of viral defense system
MDLVSYPHRSGGMDNVFTVLSELIEVMKPDALSQLAKQNVQNITWIQRLGFLLDKLQATSLSDVLQEALKQHRVQKRRLVATVPYRAAPYNEKWQLIINAELELEI